MVPPRGKPRWARLYLLFSRADTCSPPFSVLRVYADLDLECLRPLDSLFTQPISESLSPDYPLPSHYHSADPLSTSLAYVGSMNAIPNDWTMEHSIPNAFMASVPRHPLWLLPVSSVLHRFGAEEDGRVRRKAKLFGSNTENLGAETMTGPVALREAVLLYRSVIDLQLEEEGGEEGGEVGGQLASPRTLPGLAPVLGPFADAAPPRHHVAVFDHAIIYPFSWVDDSQPGYRYCRASNWFDFDALRCQGESTARLLRADKEAHIWTSGLAADAPRRSVPGVRTGISDDHVLVAHVDPKRGRQRPVFRGELNWGAEPVSEVGESRLYIWRVWIVYHIYLTVCGKMSLSRSSARPHRSCIIKTSSDPPGS